MKCILTELIKNNTGISSKSFFLVSVTLVGCLMLISLVFAIIWEELKNGYIKTDLLGVSAFVGSITTLFGAAGYTKVSGEKRENQVENKIVE